MATIPIVDLNHSSSPENQQLLREACEKWGCFRVANHGVDPALMLRMKKVVRELLDLPMEIKRRNKDVIPGSGYVAPSPKNPLYDALGLYDMGSTKAVEEFCDQLDASPHQRETILEYAKEIHGVAIELAAKMAENFGVGGGGVDSFQGWPCQFRINKYNFQPVVEVGGGGGTR